MSNRCPHCGAEAGKSHEPCPYAPGGKKYEGPAIRKASPKPAEIAAVAGEALKETAPTSRKPVTAAEVKAVSAKALEQAPKFKEAEPAAPETPGDDDAIAASHPDCKRCAQVRRQTRERVRKTREKRVSE